jgi:hypothetical protein
MSAIVDMLYREYCRARLAEMRKQLLIRGVGDKTLQVPWEDDDPADPGAQRRNWTTKESPSSIG